MSDIIFTGRCVSITQDDVKKFLVKHNDYERKVYDKNGDLVKEYVSTLDEPFTLTGIYEIPVYWPAFWNALDMVTTRSISYSDLPLSYKPDSPAEIIVSGIYEYKKSAYYKERKKAKEDALAAAAAEAERVRRDVPAITLEYEAMKKERDELEEKLLSYKQHLRSIKERVSSIDRDVAARNLPKWLKESVENLRYYALMTFDYNPHSRTRPWWSAPPKALRLSDFSEAQKADGTADRDILAQMTELVNKGFE